MSEHKTAAQLHNIARASDENIERAVGVILEVAEDRAREGQFQAHVLADTIGDVEFELVCRRLRNDPLGYDAEPWNRLNGDGTTSAGIRVNWGK